MQLSDLMPGVFKLEVKLPTGEPTGIVISLTGPDSKSFRNAGKDLARQLVQNPKLREDIDYLEKQSVVLVAACVVGWNDEGTEAFGEYTPERAAEILGMTELSYLREQIEEAVRPEKRTNFFRPAKR